MARLSRSDSAHSASWRPSRYEQDDGGDELGFPLDQRLVRHLNAVLIRNLALNPRRDALSSLAHLPPTTSVPSTTTPNGGSTGPRLKFVAMDDTDLLLRTTRRRRAGSSASASVGWGDDPADESTSARMGLGIQEEEDPAPKSSVLRRSSSGGAADLLASATIPDLGAAHEPLSGSSTAPCPSTSTLSAPSLPPSGTRRRSTSRASIASVGTTGSGATIRAVVPELDEEEGSGGAGTSKTGVKKMLEAKLGFGSAGGEGGAKVEKERREERLKRRMVDSFITLSTRPAGSPSSSASSSTTGASDRPTARTRLSRSSSSSSSHSLPLARRNRTYSSAPAFASSSTSTPPAPFFISLPHRGTTNPTFEITRGEMLVDENDAEDDTWEGLRSGRVTVGLWVRVDEPSDTRGKGKQREQASEEEWRLLREWEVEFDGLPSSFPPFPPNTLIFSLRDEYFTTPLPSHPHPHLPSSEDDLSEDDGNLSDPGTVALTARRKKREGEERARRKRREKEAVEKSRRETRMVKATGWDSIARLLELQKEVSATRGEVKEAKKRLDEVYEAGETLSMERGLEEVKDRVEDLTAVKEDLELELQDLKADLKARREALEARKDRLTAARVKDRLAREDGKEELKEVHDGELVLSSIQASIRTRRIQLITLLSQIFPVDPSPSTSSTTDLLFCVLNLPLPNSSYPSSISDDILSSALGYVAQLAATLSAYLNVPLHYPIQCLGSRSTVMDLISVMRGPRAFPLYGKGVDRYRFDYAVFLLNKNIEQLMYSQGLTVLDLRNTLPNLKSLLLSLSYDPSHESYAASTLVPSLFPQDASPLEPPFLSEDILETFVPSSTLPPSSDADSSSDGSDADETSSIPAPSVRSSSPASTLKAFRMNGRSSAVAAEKPSSIKGGAGGDGAGGGEAVKAAPASSKANGISGFMRGGRREANSVV
ncbi:uv radiation resistance protein [Pseudohyphozyma bogoriensis]|nr:uv radiation resistance protein [Pseudohyphozyma bogoriensis]